MNDETENSGTGQQYNQKRDDWYQSLRTKICVLSAVATAIYGVLMFFGFGAASGSNALHVILTPILGFILSLIIYHYIIIRQIALPGSIIVGVYSYFSFQGPELYDYMFVSGLVFVTIILISILEAHATTGKFRDFWRSFLFHPVAWAKQFDIETRI